MTNMLSKASLGLAAGFAGTLFLGYCIYFDRKRRSDPEFKRKLHERRKAKKEATTVKTKNTSMPNLQDHEAVQRYFLEEVQLGEEMLANGEVEKGVEHLANAVAVCGQPHQLLQVLQQTLPTNVFRMLIERMQVLASQVVSPGRISIEDLE